MIIRSAVGNSMNWQELARIIKQEKKSGNYIAAMIHKLKLESNEV